MTMRGRQHRRQGEEVTACDLVGKLCAARF